MNLAPTGDEQRLRDEVRAWLREHLPWEYGRGLPPRFEDLAEEVSFLRAWQRQLAEGRWVGVAWPEEHGGRGAGPVEHFIVTEELGRMDELLDLALRLEDVAINDSYFVDHKLYPNVDFYSGLIYRAMGFPTQMFPVLFAMGRLPGWIAHWKEMMESPATKIGRPRQIYVGPTKRPYVSVDERG